MPSPSERRPGRQLAGFPAPDSTLPCPEDAMPTASVSPQRLAALPSPARPAGREASAGGLVTCRGEVEIGSFLFASLDAAFYDWDEPTRLLARFSGSGGGGSIGGGKLWGATVSTRPITTLIGQDVHFEVLFLPLAVYINWGIAGEQIVSFVGSGIAVGSGLFMGSGRFSER